MRFEFDLRFAHHCTEMKGSKKEQAVHHSVSCHELNSNTIPIWWLLWQKRCLLTLCTPRVM